MFASTAVERGATTRPKPTPASRNGNHISLYGSLADSVSAIHATEDAEAEDHPHHVRDGEAAIAEKPERKQGDACAGLPSHERENQHSADDECADDLEAAPARVVATDDPVHDSEHPKTSEQQADNVGAHALSVSCPVFCWTNIIRRATSTWYRPASDCLDLSVELDHAAVTPDDACRQLRQSRR
jgi:hypothetical protein